MKLQLNALNRWPNCKYALGARVKNFAILGIFSILILGTSVVYQNAEAAREGCDSNLGDWSDSEMVFCLYGIGELPVEPITKRSLESSLVEPTAISVPDSVLLGVNQEFSNIDDATSGVFDHITGIGTEITPMPLIIQPPELTPFTGPWEEFPEFSDVVAGWDIECSISGLNCFYVKQTLDRGPVTGFEFFGDPCESGDSCFYYSVMDDSINTLTSFSLVESGGLITGINPQITRTLTVPQGIILPPVYSTVSQDLPVSPDYSCGQDLCSSGNFWYDGLEYDDSGNLYGAFNTIILDEPALNPTFFSRLVLIPTGGVGDITPIPIGDNGPSSTRGYAYDSSSAIMYATGGSSNFYQVDLNDGTRSADIATSASNSLQFGPDGQLYSSLTGNPGQLVIVNPLDATSTPLPNPTGISFARGLTLTSVNDPGDRPIGGTVGSLDTATLLVAGAQANMGLWSLALVGIVAAGAAITYKLKSKKTEQ